MTDPFKNILLGLKNIIENLHLTEGHLKIKNIASNELKVAIKGDEWSEINHFSTPLAKPFFDVMTKEDAIPICAELPRPKSQRLPLIVSRCSQRLLPVGSTIK